MIDLATAGSDPVNYHVDATRGLVFITLRGHVTFVDLHRVQSLILSDPRYRDGMSLFIDCRILTAIPSHDEIHTLAFEPLFRPVVGGRARVAVVAMTRLGFAFALALDSFLCASEDDIGLFTSHIEARAWIGAG